jgi:hypothetical protein
MLAMSLMLALGAAHAQVTVGPTIGLIDTGVRSSHVDLRGIVQSGYNAIDGSTDTRDLVGHGTHVAGILATRAGAGANLAIMPVQVFTNVGATDASLSAGLNWASARVGILNLSLSAGAPVAGAAIRDAVAKGALVVVAAGNRGASQADWPARFAAQSWANGPQARGAVIAVGAVDANNRIADFSNRAGDTAQWFLVAPGVEIRSSHVGSDTGQVLMSGTSMAAPAVSGAAARLQATWPRLSPKDVGSILLVTARDLGARGTDPIYGRGLLDVDAAMRPVGTLSSATGTGTVTVSGSTAMRLSPATVALAQPAAASGLTVVGVDSYRRDYTVNLQSRLADPLPMMLGRSFDVMDLRIQQLEKMLPDGTRLLVQGAESFALIRNDEAGEFAFGAGNQGGQYFGIGAGFDVTALANPYAALTPRGAMLARGLRYGDTMLKAGLYSGAATEPNGIAWTQVEARTLLLELSHRVSQGVALSATWSNSQEQGAWLGSIGSGGMTVNQKVQTEAVQFGAALNLAPKTILASSYAVGRTPTLQTSGVVGVVSDSVTEAMSVALIQRDAFMGGDGLSVSVSQPLRTRSGTIAASLQSGVDADGNPVISKRNLSLVPSGRELLTELAYRAPLGRDSSVSAVLAVRQQPNHDATAPIDAMVALRFRQLF